MKTITTYPIEYLKGHLACKEIKPVLPASIFKKVRWVKEKVVTSALVIFFGLFFVIVFLRLSASSNITAYVNDEIPDKIFIEFAL